MKLRKVIYLILICFLIPMSGLAVGMSGTTYKIEFDSINIGGNDFATSANYMISDTLGEAGTGFSNSANYRMYAAGYRQSDVTLSIGLSTSSLDLGSIDQNASASGAITTTITTNAADGYDLYIKESQVLTSGANTISDFPGTIAVPIAWSGYGFGFTISSGTSVDAKWGSGANYAGMPTSSTVIHSKTGFSALPDDTTTTFNVSIGDQTEGTYNTTVTFTALPRL